MHRYGVRIKEAFGHFLHRKVDGMTNQIRITDVANEEVTAAYFDLEFCNELDTHHNIPVAIGVSYRRGGREIGSYCAKIWCGDDYKLWEDQLERIGYREEMLRKCGKPMEEVTDDLFAAHKTYGPALYISLGRQDEDLLRRYLTQSPDAWEFYDAVRLLPGKLSLKYDISLEKYAYVCGISFVHQFLPLEDARCLADIIRCVLRGEINEERRRQVEEEYDKKIFISQYKNKRQAYEYLLEQESLTPGQKEKLRRYEDYLKTNRELYLACGGITMRACRK